MSEETLRPNDPVKFESRNMRPRFKRLRAGDIFIVEYEVEESVWNSLRTVPEDALLENVLWWHDGDPDPNAKPPESEKPPKEPAGPYSFYWERMCAKGVKTYPDLQEALDCTFDQVWDRLHAEFETDTMATVSPRQWEAWVQIQGLSEGLITLSRSAEQQAAAKEN